MLLLRRPLAGLPFFGTSFLVAVGIAFGLRELLPYEALRRTTPEAQFIAWEGAVWMIGLVLVALGGATLMENIDLLKKRGRGSSTASHRPGRSPGFELVPWWMLSAGVTLLLLAGWARTQLGA